MAAENKITVAAKVRAANVVRLDRIVTAEQRTRSWFIDEALDEWLNKREKSARKPRKPRAA
jgi:predicted transcriptional regulator